LLSKVRVKPPIITCKVCCNRTKNIVKTCASHEASVCKDCTFTYLKQQIVVYGRCNCCSCGQFIPISTLQVLNKELFEMYNDVLLRNLLNQMGAVYCPGKNCGAAMIPPAATGRKKCDILMCTECDVKFCVLCKEQHNSKLTCKKFLAGLDRKERRNVSWKQGHTKLCPKCHVNIEKDAGCDSMYCVNCRTSFSWMHAPIPSM